MNSGHGEEERPKATAGWEMGDDSFPLDASEAVNGKGPGLQVTDGPGPLVSDDFAISLALAGLHDRSSRRSASAVPPRHAMGEAEELADTVIGSAI